MSDDPVRIQVDIRLRVPKGKKPGRKIIEQAIDRWAFNGVESKFIQVRAVHWLNPQRKRSSLARWKVATAADVTGEEYARLMIPGEKMTGDTLEQARRSLRLPSMPAEAYAGILFVKDVTRTAAVARPGKKNAKKRKGKVSKVRNPKRNDKKK